MMFFVGLSVRASAGRLRTGRSLAEWASLSQVTGKPGCPVDYDVPMEDGEPSPLHVASVNNFVDNADHWWTEQRVLEFEGPMATQGGPYKIAPSAVEGCGMFATRRITKGEKIGVVWVPDNYWKAVVHFSPWFGRAINHCPEDKSTTRLELQSDNSVWSVAKKDIDPGEELTGDYNEAHASFPYLVQGADPAWTC